MADTMLTAEQAKALEWVLREALDFAWERDLEPKDALSDANDLLQLAELLSHEQLTASATELRDKAQKLLDAVPPVPGALMPAYEAALNAWAQENREPVISAGAILLWRARRAVYAALWFVENVGEGTPDRQDIFFKVREIAGDAR